MQNAKEAMQQADDWLGVPQVRCSRLVVIDPSSGCGLSNQLQPPFYIFTLIRNQEKAEVFYIVSENTEFETNIALCMIQSPVFFLESHTGGGYEIFITELTS